MAMASMPKRMESVIDQKYPKWREVELALPDLGRGWAYYKPTAMEIRSCLSSTLAKTSRPERTCSQHERILGLCS